MAETAGILVFTLWYIAIAVAYIRGQLGGKVEDEETKTLKGSEVSLPKPGPRTVGEIIDDVAEGLGIPPPLPVPEPKLKTEPDPEPMAEAAPTPASALAPKPEFRPESKPESEHKLKPEAPADEE